MPEGRRSITARIALAWFEAVLKHGPKPRLKDLRLLVRAFNSLDLYSPRQLHLIDPDFPESNLTDFDVLSDDQFLLARKLQRPLHALLESLPAVTHAFKDNELTSRTIHSLGVLEFGFMK